MAVEILAPFVLLVTTTLANGAEFKSYGPEFDTREECRAFANEMRAGFVTTIDELGHQYMAWFCGGTYSEADKWFHKGARVYVIEMNLHPRRR